MTRTGAFKAAYYLQLAALAALLVAGDIALRRGHGLLAGALLAAFTVALLAGRVQAWLWSDLLAGLHDLNQGEHHRSRTRTRRFLARLRRRPWLKHLIWLGGSSYSRNAEVLALNNLGAAELALGEVEAARTHLARAIALDPKCPLPYRNMGALTLRTGSSTEARPWLEKAIELGLRGDWSDRRAFAIQRNNAALSTTGRFVARRRPPIPAAPAIAGDYVVELLNDDATPFEVVVEGLEQVFALSGAEAVAVAAAADRSGRAACAGFDDEAVARRRAESLMAFARARGSALGCVVRPPSLPA
ncbi:MAG TPA: ATP-dependent Clp protease adaptor ClpS [Caulobacteraceae bacterium]|nr:ATP-dependent Clp protease adaptor ClpS [Caulobacteraceae bacterium]